MGSMSRWRDVTEGLADLLAPLSCAGCGAVAERWCASCARELTRVRPVERPVLAGGPPVFALGRYRGAGRRGVVAYKVSGRRDLARPFGHAVASALLRAGTRRAWCFVPAPSRPLVARRRGGAHMARVARAAATELTGSLVSDCLLTRGAAQDSVGLGAQERLRNLAGRVGVRSHRLAGPELPVVLVDDVVTTGATIACSVEALRSAGREVSLALVLTCTSGASG